MSKSQQLVFSGTVDGSAAALDELTQEDLQFLFKN
jgi:hypothetical protein